MFVRSLIALTLASLSVARAIPLVARDEQHWRPDFEPYDVYHARYIAIGCQNQHDTPFFDACCHPRENDIDLSTIPEQCLGPDDFCDDDDPSSAAPSSTAPLNVAPVPTLPVAPSPSPSQSPSPTQQTTSAKPTPTNPPGGSDGNTITGKGQGTYFLQHNTAGACGKVHADSSTVVALDSRLYGGGKYCGKTIHITNTKNGKTVTATVADECPTCASQGSVDMSVGTFTQIATEEEGDVPIVWTIDL